MNPLHIIHSGESLLTRSRDQSPFIFGDVFNDVKGNDFTLFDIKDERPYGLLKHANNRAVQFGCFNSINEMLDRGYKPNQEFIDKDTELKEKNTRLFAPRKLTDNTWAALTPLMTTTAICIDFNEYIMYESRYCFRESDFFPSQFNALYWLSRLEDAESLPVGNVAYRGYLGTKPILDPHLTEKYYSDLSYLKDYPILNGMDLFQYSNHFMTNHIDQLITESKTKNIQRNKQNFKPIESRN